MKILGPDFKCVPTSAGAMYFGIAANHVGVWWIFKSRGQARPGRQHLLDSEYFERISAMDYAMTHDDGQAVWDLKKRTLFCWVSREHPKHQRVFTWLTEALKLQYSHCSGSGVAARNFQSGLTACDRFNQRRWKPPTSASQPTSDDE